MISSCDEPFTSSHRVTPRKVVYEPLAVGCAPWLTDGGARSTEQGS